MGTPAYVYSLSEVRARLRGYREAFPRALICYAFKANPSLAITRLLASLGAGAEVVSGGELRQALRAGFPEGRMVFNGNGKTDAELREAVRLDLLAINLDAPAELERLPGPAPVAVRVNPDLDPGTHPHLATGLGASKFGVPQGEALQLLQRAADQGHRPAGFHVHLGSQIRDPGLIALAASRLAALSRRGLERGLPLTHLNLGGGLAVPYSGLGGPTPAELAEALAGPLEGLPLDLVLEPGRSLVASAGLLLTSVIQVKGSLAVVDTGMHHLLRPALYGAYHRVRPLRWRSPERGYQVVGPICESADVLARDRRLPPLAPGDRLAILDVGAYGSVLASRYNAQPLPAEVAVEGERWHLLRAAEPPDTHLERESLPPWMD